MLKRFVALGALALSVAAGSAATADQAQPSDAPTPPPVPTVPPTVKLDPYARYAIDVLGGLVRQQVINLTNVATGRVTYFRRFDMQVDSGGNAYRQIHLHQGTVINPRGATVAPGQRVEVTGVPQPGGTLEASVITILQ